MKKLVKILATMSVAVATFAFVSCADVTVGTDMKFPEPAAPAADDEPAERTVGTVYNYILDYPSTNADFNAVWSNVPGVIQAKVRNLGTTEKPNKVTEYAFIGDSFHSATYVEYDTGLKITDNNTSIEVEVVQNGIKLTYKLFDATKDLIPAGTYNLKSMTTIVNGVSTAITSADTAAWALLDDDEKTATVAANGAITWDGDTVTQVEAANGGISVTVSADAVTVAIPGDEYTTYVYSFTKAPAASSGSGSGSGGSGSGGSSSTTVNYTCTAIHYSADDTTITSSDDGWDPSAFAALGAVSKQGSNYCFAGVTGEDYYSAAECAGFGYTISDVTDNSFKVTDAAGDTFTFTAS